MSTQYSTTTDRERYLKDELDRFHEAEERRIDESRRERQRQMEEWREQADRRQREADTWPEALLKNIPLLRQEIIEGEPESEYFENSARANEQALAIWKEVAAARKAEIDELQNRIEAIEAEIVEAVATRLEESNGHTEWQNVAEMMRTMTPSNFLDW